MLIIIITKSQLRQERKKKKERSPGFKERIKTSRRVGMDERWRCGKNSRFPKEWTLTFKSKIEGRFNEFFFSFGKFYVSPFSSFSSPSFWIICHANHYTEKLNWTIPEWKGREGEREREREKENWKWEWMKSEWVYWWGQTTIGFNGKWRLFIFFLTCATRVCWRLTMRLIILFHLYRNGYWKLKGKSWRERERELVRKLFADRQKHVLLRDFCVISHSVSYNAHLKGMIKRNFHSFPSSAIGWQYIL